MGMNRDQSTAAMGKCPICGKDFFMTVKTEWAYRRTPTVTKKHKESQKTHYFCSWTCMRKFDEQREKEGFRPNERGRKAYHSRHG